MFSSVIIEIVDGNSTGLDDLGGEERKRSEKNIIIEIIINALIICCLFIYSPISQEKIM